MAWSGSERRENKRFGVKGCSIQYKHTKLFGLLGSFSNRYLVLNISPTGLSFISKEEIHTGDKISLLITAPLLENGEINLKGEVVWVKKSEQHQAYRNGVKFIDPSKKAKLKLRLILDNALLDQIDISTRVYLKEVNKL
ncbi:MAG: PilZ domain-containing protein [Planctomycetes bacterium]|nr:PilZ domain-containing protein [Planctomycetota bacterium]